LAKLKPKWRKAITLYLSNGNNQAAAYRDAGYPDNKWNAANFFKRPVIVAEIERRMKIIWAKEDYDVEQYVRTLLNGINFDPTILLDEEGNITKDTIQNVPNHLRIFLQKIRKQKDDKYLVDVVDKASLLSLVGRALNPTHDNAAVNINLGPQVVEISEYKPEEGDNNGVGEKAAAKSAGETEMAVLPQTANRLGDIEET